MENAGCDGTFYRHMDRDGVYHGEIKNGIPHGVGELRCDEVTRRGNWINGILMDGSTHWHNGDTFVGTFHENGHDKRGKCTFAAGGIEFDGTFNNEGDFEYGVMKNMGHDRTGHYKGHFFDGKRSGTGALYVAGTLYEGNWADDKLDGEGKMTIMTVGNNEQPNIEASGIWKDDHLDGSLRCKNGTMCDFVGTIKSVSSVAVGDGKITMPNGLMYHGHFEDTMPMKYGKISWPGIAFELPVFSDAFHSFCIVSPDQYRRLSGLVIEKHQDPITLEDIDDINMTEYLLHFRLKLDEPEPIKLWHPVKAAVVGRELHKCPHCRLNYPDNLRTWIATEMQRIAATKIQRFVRSRTNKRKSHGGTKRSGTKRSGTKRSGTKRKSKRTAQRRLLHQYQLCCPNKDVGAFLRFFWGHIFTRGFLSRATAVGHREHRTV
jgi:hypothetical protein